MSHPLWNSPRRLKVSSLRCQLGPRLTRTRHRAGLAAVVAGIGLSACGGSSGGGQTQARALLSDTFSSHHPVQSGRLEASLSITPHGSNLITQPVTLSFGGPFQSRGSGRLPQSDFHIGITFQGHTGQLGIISTGTQGFVTLSGTAYTLPASSFRQLESGVTAVGGGGAGAGAGLARLGVHPQHWLIDPRVVGTAQVGGARTDHIHGRLALGPLLADFSTILSRASSLSATTSTLSPLSPATQRRLAGEITGASFDLWTGISDHSLRRLAVTATVPVSGRTRTQFGGLSAATITFDLAYSDVGQPQHIATPAQPGTYAQFRQRLAAVELAISSLISGSSSSAGG